MRSPRPWPRATPEPAHGALATLPIERASMSRVAIKICGVSTPDAIEAALNGGASHIGFMHFPKSPRHLSLAQMADLAPCVRGALRSVAVLVDPDDALIDAVIAAGAPHILQLHGREEPARVAAIAARTGLEIWKVISVKTAANLTAGSAYAGAAHRLLYDAKTPDDAPRPGGMGQRFDWSLLVGHRAPLPWALSGGLAPTNVAEAIRATGASLVDVSSGVENAPGIKDVDKIAAFCKAVSQC